MKKLTYLFSTLALVLVFGGNAFGQEITASAEIVSEISYSEGSDLDFGQILNTVEENVVVHPFNDSETNQTTGYSVGSIEIVASSGAYFDLDFTSDNELTIDGDGEDTIGFTPIYSGTESEDGEPEIIEDGEDIELGDEHDTYYIFYGGELDSDNINDAADGTYTGTITVTASYM